MDKTVINRIIELIRSPRTAWTHIKEENKSVREIQNRFFYPLLIIVALATFLGAVINYQEFAFDQALKNTVIVLTSRFAGYFITIVILNELITSRIFNMEKQYAACVRLVAYSSSIMLCTNTIVALLPDLFILYAVNIYTAYIIWEGSGIVLKGMEENRKGIFTVLCFLLLYISPYMIEGLMYLMMR